jgi:hypothetical protein
LWTLGKGCHISTVHADALKNKKKETLPSARDLALGKGSFIPSQTTRTLVHFVGSFIPFLVQLLAAQLSSSPPCPGRLHLLFHDCFVAVRTLHTTAC